MSRPLAILLIVSSVVGGAACGHKIGDSCNISSDCAQDGTRVCDTFSPGGYCTIQGCDFGTCPGEAVCVRFFPALENATPCTTQNDCQIDEVCTVGGQCAPSSIEQRFCMLSCSGSGDCRDGYECRNRDLQKMHGGEPVPDPTAASADPPNKSFCGSRRQCSVDNDCDITVETCDLGSRTCVPK
jgi:hypothetical protein